VITVNKATSYYSAAPESRVISWGGAPWDHISSDANNEEMRGVLRRVGTWTVAKTYEQLVAMRLAVTPDLANSWYWNANPTADDIGDKSGAGHHPAWRATTWSG
jgi:hypothetical protein